MPRQISHGHAPLSGKQPVWDLPVRLVHWTLAGLVLFSWWSAEYHHTGWHIWSGIAILTLLVFRLLWGFVGSSTARWSRFIRGPWAIFNYLRGSWYGIGHNPLGALSVIAMFLALAVQVGLGLISEDEDGLYAGPLAPLVSIERSDWAHEVHHRWFNVILALIALHLATILFYRLRGKKLTAPMITGKAAVPPRAQPMRPAKWWVAVICLAIALAVASWVVAGAPPFGS